MDIPSVNLPGHVLPAMPDTISPNWLVENRRLIQSIKGINAAELFGQDSELSFALDRDAKRPVVRVINRQTHEVLWQLPPEYVLQLDREFRARS